MKVRVQVKSTVTPWSEGQVFDLDAATLPGMCRQLARNPELIRDYGTVQTRWSVEK